MVEFIDAIWVILFSGIMPPAVPAYFSLIFFSALVVLVITVFNRLLVDQDKVRAIREEQKETQKKIKEMQKENPGEANKMLQDSLKKTNSLLMMNMKAMIPTLLFVATLLPWLSASFASPVVLLPFDLPYFGADFGWLMWYFITSLPFSVVFRKVLGVA